RWESFRISNIIISDMFLNCHSYHSLRYGTISVKELVQQCVELNIQVAALTDINTITGVYDFHRLCRMHGIKPVVGMEIRNDNNLYYICLAKSKHGLGEINSLLTGHNCEGKELPKHHPFFSDVFTIYPLSDFPAKLKSNEYIGVRPEELNLLVNPKLIRYLSRMVILQPVTFRTKKEYNLHRILRAIDLNTLITKLEENDYCKENEKLIPVNDLLSAYRQYPQIIQNTTWMLEQCHFEFDYTIPKNKKHFTGSKESDFRLLQELAYKGLKERYPHDKGTAKARVEKELTVINLLNFSAYFLSHGTLYSIAIQWDLCTWEEEAVRTAS
ncbi:MAG TPA: PHP domain-containing protein, partial [Pseudosphingobacterium sp.]|nr:PHP domain-containing protein [Pseudosphingobacterium sp.]